MIVAYLRPQKACLVLMLLPRSYAGFMLLFYPQNPTNGASRKGVMLLAAWLIAPGAYVVFMLLFYSTYRIPPRLQVGR